MNDTSNPTRVTNLPAKAGDKADYSSYFYTRIKLRNPETGAEKWYRREDVDDPIPSASSPCVQSVVAHIDAFANAMAETKLYEDLPDPAKAASIQLAHALSDLRKTLLRIITP